MPLNLIVHFIQPRWQRYVSLPHRSGRRFVHLITESVTLS